MEESARDPYAIIVIPSMIPVGGGGGGREPPIKHWTSIMCAIISGMDSSAAKEARRSEVKWSTEYERKA